MMTPYEQRKLMLELFYLKPSLYIPEKSEAEEVSDVALRNELKALQRSNERMRKHLAALQARNEELEAYAHTVAHNLKNPLSVIILTSDAIAEINDLTPRELTDFMQQIRSTAYDMNDTIDDLLLLSEVRKVDAPAELVDMDRVVANIRKRLGSMVKEYQGHIITPKNWPTSIGYAPWIEEVWANYISNALKYGGRPACVELGASPQPDGMVRFWVRDNGAGIPVEAQAHLFTQFKQLGPAHKAGHGLGLSIVRHIVEKLGGQVGVDSVAGQGSLFYFTLPGSQTIAEPASEKAFSM